MLNDALLYESYEIIRGEKIMAPSAGAYHNNVMGGLYIRIGLYVRTRGNGYVFTDSMDVHLPDGNLVKPDLTVIKAENAAIINWQKSINGTPDMVVEVLSRSTKKRDLTVKKDAYEKNGVKEYWIVDPLYQSIDVYILRDGKFQLDGEYTHYEEDDVEWVHMSEEDKAAVKSEITLSIFPDLTIKLSEIFVWAKDFGY